MKINPSAPASGYRQSAWQIRHGGGREQAPGKLQSPDRFQAEVTKCVYNSSRDGIRWLVAGRERRRKPLEGNRAERRKREKRKKRRTTKDPEGSVQRTAEAKQL